MLLIVLGKLFLNMYCTMYSLNHSRYATKRNKANVPLKQGHTISVLYYYTAYSKKLIYFKWQKCFMPWAWVCWSGSHGVSEGVRIAEKLNTVLITTLLNMDGSEGCFQMGDHPGSLSAASVIPQMGPSVWLPS